MDRSQHSTSEDSDDGISSDTSIDADIEKSFEHFQQYLGNIEKLQEKKDAKYHYEHITERTGIGHLSTLKTSGGTFSASSPASYWELVERQAGQIPAPGDYGENGIPNRPGSRRVTGGKISSSTDPYGSTGRPVLERDANPDAASGPQRSTLRTTGAGGFSRAPLDLGGSKGPGPKYNVRGKLSSLGTTMGRSLGPTLLDHIEKERSEVPGPGAYDLPNLDKNVSGGAFSLAEPPNDVDIAMRRAREVPGPGHYKLPDLGSDGGGALLLGLCPTDVDIAMRRSKEVPGPGKYPLKSTLDRGQTISKSAKVPIFREILSRTTLVPSPACYAPDMSKPLVTNVGRHSISNVLIGRGKRTNFLDEVMRLSKTVPGHEYQVNGSSLKLSGGRFSTAKPKSDIEWKIYEASRLPGPKYSTTTKRSISEQRQAKRDAQQTRRARDRILAQSGLIEPGVPVHERLYRRHLKTAQAARKRRKEREEESLFAKTHPLGEVRVHTLRRFSRKDEQRTPRDEPVKADAQASGPTFDAHGNNMKSVDLKMDGDQAMEDKSPAKALRCYSSALTLQPITEQLRNNILVRRAAALVKLESLDKALADLDKCLASDPRHRRAHQRRGVVLSLLGRHKEAMNDLLF